jgi:hypothetical protein
MIEDIADKLAAEEVAKLEACDSSMTSEGGSC